MKRIIMIYIFRKGMKKWHSVLWIVAASMLLSGIGMIFLGKKHLTEMEVASVNGSSITFNEFRRSFLKIQEQVNRMRPLARAYGLSEEAFFQTFFGASRPEEVALDMCVKDELIDSVKKRFGVVIDKQLLEDELLKTLKAELPHVIDASGEINIETYSRSLEHANITPAEYEQQKEEAMKRQLIQRFAQLSSYIPRFVARDIFNAEYAKKSFSVITFPLNHFINLAKKEPVSDDVLVKYYEEKKEKYRVHEKRKATYWTLSPEAYEKNIVINENAITRFYNKSQSSLYRIPPKVKVRHIFVKSKDEAQKIYDEVVNNPERFSDLAKKHSLDEKTAKAGGLTELFVRGSYDDEFEKAAFRLHEVGSITPPVMVKNGFEIIQLVERENASVKPLVEVRDQIEKKLKAKKTQQALRSDLETVLRRLRDDEAALDQFAKDHNLKATETAFLSQEGSEPDSIDTLIAEHLFSSKKRESGYGYFNHKKQSILYKLSGVEKSYIPPFDKVKTEITEHYYKKEAKKILQTILAESKVALLEQKMTPELIAKTHGIPLIETEEFTKGQKPKDLKGMGALNDQLASLTDKNNQVLQYKHQDNYYLAQIKSLEIDAKDSESKILNIIKKEKYKSESLHVSAFIASLYRNAKIEVDRKVLGGHQAD